jgi:hypothetical protein
MSANVFTSTEHPVTDSELDDVQKECGFVFPQPVRLHYLRYNGGCPRRCLYKKGQDTFVVQEFLPVKYGTGRLEDSFHHLKIDDDILPDGFVPFAVDPLGDYFCFSVRPNDRGSIWLYIGEYRDEPARALEYLATSLPDLLETMTEEEE